MATTKKPPSGDAGGTGDGEETEVMKTEATSTFWKDNKTRILTAGGLVLLLALCVTAVALVGGGGSGSTAQADATTNQNAVEPGNCPESSNIDGSFASEVKEEAGRSVAQVKQEIICWNADDEGSPPRPGHAGNKFVSALDGAISPDQITKAESLKVVALAGLADSADRQGYLNRLEGRRADAPVSGTAKEQWIRLREILVDKGTNVDLRTLQGSARNWAVVGQTLESEVQDFRDLKVAVVTAPDGSQLILKLEANSDPNELCFNVLELVHGHLVPSEPSPQASPPAGGGPGPGPGPGPEPETVVPQGEGETPGTPNTPEEPTEPHNEIPKHDTPTNTPGPTGNGHPQPQSETEAPGTKPGNAVPPAGTTVPHNEPPVPPAGNTSPPTSSESEHAHPTGQGESWTE